MTPSAIAADLYDALDAEDVARVDTRHAFICGYQEGVTGPAQAYRVQAYEQGHRAGRAEALDESAAVELIADGYTAAQEARADALAAASRLFAESLGTDWDDPDDPANAARAVLAVAAEFATWIEHGDPAPATLAEHFQTAMDLVGAARDVVADAAKMAQPRTRPTADRPNQ